MGEAVTEQAKRLPIRRHVTLNLMLYAGNGTVAYLDEYPGGAPMVVIADGTSEICLMPPGPHVTTRDIDFADMVSTVMHRYLDKLRAIITHQDSHRP